MYYLDHLRSPHSIPCIITPRTSVYTTDIIKKIIKADKRSRSGHIYGLLDVINPKSFRLQFYFIFYIICILKLIKPDPFQFRSMVGTCYSMGSRQLVPNIRIESLHSNFFQDLSPRKSPSLHSLPQQMKGEGESSGPRPDGSGHSRRSSRRIAGKFSYQYSRRIAGPYSCWIGGGSLVRLSRRIAGCRSRLTRSSPCRSSRLPGTSSSFASADHEVGFLGPRVLGSCGIMESSGKLCPSITRSNPINNLGLGRHIY